MPQLSEVMRRYRALEDDLRLVRGENAPGSALEDPILEEMAHLWWELSDIERETLDREGPTCWPDQAGPTEGGLGLTDRDTISPTATGPLRSGGAR